MKKFISFCLKLLVIMTVIAGVVYVIKTYFSSDDEDEFVDDYKDLDFRLDEDLKDVNDREYVTLSNNNESNESESL
ncbi:hypothetical protein M2454_000394 [Aequitasia blattaphilus]|uniref:Secreted protein n=1 Tax=Aequitasia blattaphilus TaxID=2949332 RepID=A0ABT1E5U7_9FIRM|nr:hypothetical protein [Aequitasia blattaphilus]MCP1101215.1 hypothetical protein [Aequitasia blattaphilus]MCR8613855.1 hypothetical protein [Aequitasia blattaphilus]